MNGNDKRPFGPGTVPGGTLLPLAWEDKVMGEAMAFVRAGQMNFAHGLDVSKEHLPANDKKHRMIQLDLFFDAIVGLTVNVVTSYGSLDPVLEDAVITQMRAKFKYVRERQAEGVRAAAKDAPT